MENISWKQSESVTDIPQEVVTHKWIIKKFSSYKRTDELSSSWTTKGNLYGKVTWTLKFRPNVILPGGKSRVSFSLLWNKDKIDADISISFISTIKEKSEVFQLSTDSYTSGGQCGHCRKIILNKDNNLLLNDKLTIYCKIILKGTIVCSVVHYNLLEVPKCSMLKDFQDVFENEKFSDVTLSVDGEDFHAHKVILAARSPVFKAMFEHDMTENLKNRVVISDVKKEIMREMLRFIYTDAVVNIETMACELLAVADKYDLQRLKAMCVQVIARDLTIENAVDALLLADSLSNILRAQVFSFILKNAKEVVETMAFKSLEKTHPHLLTEIFRVYLNFDVSQLL